MAIKTYYRVKPQKLSEHFSSYEFRCGIGRFCSCTTTLIDDQLVEILEKIRAYFDRPITITSGYRCPSYNRSVGGATGSYHSRGMAADIVVQGVPPRAVAACAEMLGVKGIGLYETQKDSFFVHVDSRTAKSYWYGQAQAPRSTFGGEANCAAYKAKTTAAVKIETPAAPVAKAGDLPYRVKITAAELNVRSAPMLSSARLRSVLKNTIHTITEEQSGWGKLQDGGWVNLQYVTTVSDGGGDPATPPYKCVVTAQELNVRSGPGLSYGRQKTIRKGTEHTVTEVKDGWGKLDTGGWVSLEYVTPVK